MDNQQSFLESLTALSEIFDKKLSAPMIKMYWSTLKEFTDEQVGEAMVQALNSFKFMPKPSEIRELIQGSADDAAVDEWANILNQIQKIGSHGKPKLSQESARVVDQLGGWSQLCKLTYRELDFKAKKFEEIYSGKVKKGLVAIGHSSSPAGLLT